ncbi:hypothetical protein K439DRAFT_1377412 [Ramaria rubella]|nr:hypothetical protein K439DRAFT_1377412 [Ramaria rubella]
MRLRPVSRYYYQYNSKRLSTCTSCHHAPQLSQIQLRFDLHEELNFEDNVSEISSKEHVFPEYPLSILQFPRIAHYKPDTQLRRQISTHLATEYLKPAHFIFVALPMEMECWGKMCIGDGGDCIRTSTTASNCNGHDTSFVQYDLLVDIHTNKMKKPSMFETRCFYGQLQLILVCTLPTHNLFEPVPCCRLLAVVCTCETNGFDATIGPVTYTNM